MTLRGVVPTFTMVAEIERAVSSIPGITRFDNQLQVADRAGLALGSPSL